MELRDLCLDRTVLHAIERHGRVSCRRLEAVPQFVQLPEVVTTNMDCQLSVNLEAVGGGQCRDRAVWDCPHSISPVLRMAATSLRHSKSALGAAYGRTTRLKGASVAVFATARKLAQLVYRMLSWGRPISIKARKSKSGGCWASRPQTKPWAAKWFPSRKLTLPPFESRRLRLFQARLSTEFSRTTVRRTAEAHHGWAIEQPALAKPIPERVVRAAGGPYVLGCAPLIRVNSPIWELRSAPGTVNLSRSAFNRVGS